MDDTGARPADVLDIRSTADPSELSAIRHRVREHIVGSGGEPSLAEDIELVVSELATNVIEHTRSTTLSISVWRASRDWFVDVADVDDLEILDDVALPDLTEPTGRGLFVVSSIVDDISIVEVDGHYNLRCRLATL